MHCDCNKGTQENFEEEDCDSGFDNEEIKLQEYDQKLKDEKGYTYCNCYGVNS